jgi:hypothetical protein
VAFIRDQIEFFIRYALSRWEGLTRFIDDGRIELDTNAVERSISPITLIRKNALFASIVNGHPNSDIDQMLPWAYCRQESRGQRTSLTPNPRRACRRYVAAE